MTIVTHVNSKMNQPPNYREMGFFPSQLLGHIGLQYMKVGEKTIFGRLATIFQICSMDADILS